MKKWMVWLTVIVMLVSMTACGKGPSDPSKNPDGAPAVDGTKVETPLWTLVYDEAVWTLAQEDMTTDEDYCRADLKVADPDDEDGYLVYVTIEADIGDPYDFRDDLAYYGFDAYEYAENNAYPFETVGGVDCLTYTDDGYEYETRYFNRLEAASASVSVDISAKEANDARVATLLSGLTFTLTDIGHEDGPWEWEGEAFSAVDATVPVGDVSLQAAWVPFEEYISTRETFDHNVAVVGNTAYVLVEGELRAYAFDGKTLTFQKTIELPEEDYDAISATDDGSLWVGGSMNDTVCVKDGQVTATYDDLDTLSVAPSGEWGVSYFTGNECEKVTLTQGNPAKTPIVFGEVDTISYLRVENDAIYVCGSAADESGHKVFVYSPDGALQKTLCDEEGEGLGSITFITRTADGYLGFDGNMREVVLWDANGQWKGAADDGDLFGTDYPWFCASDLLPDGGLLTVMTETREDESAMELVAFTVKGF